jgi:hypothetical protein
MWIVQVSRRHLSDLRRELQAIKDLGQRFIWRQQEPPRTYGAGRRRALSRYLRFAVRLAGLEVGELDRSAVLIGQLEGWGYVAGFDHFLSSFTTAAFASTPSAHTDRSMMAAAEKEASVEQNDEHQRRRQELKWAPTLSGRFVGQLLAHRASALRERSACPSGRIRVEVGSSSARGDCGRGSQRCVPSCRGAATGSAF